MSDVVERTRRNLLATVAGHEWPDPSIRERATRDLLALVEAVPYRGDDQAYIVEAWTLACALMNPIVEQSRAEMVLRRLRTSKSIH